MADSNGSTAAGGGIGITGAVFLVFLVLKLCGVIAWSWWWVTAPLWGPLALVVAVAVVFGVAFVLITAYAAVTDRIRRNRRGSK